MNISFVLNGKPISIDVEPATLLCDLLRETLALTGTHVGCDTALGLQRTMAARIVLFRANWLAAGRLAAPLARAVLADVVGVVPEEGRVRHVIEDHGQPSDFDTFHRPSDYNCLESAGR
jgi:hypothetical protein